MKLEQYRVSNLSENNLGQSINLGDIQIILFSSDGLQPKREGYKNLLAVDALNNIVWTADLPEGYLYASYWTIEIRDNDLYALCGSFLCKIDIETGKIISEQFVK